MQKELNLKIKFRESFFIQNEKFFISIKKIDFKIKLFFQLKINLKYISEKFLYKMEFQ